MLKKTISLFLLLFVKNIFYGIDPTQKSLIFEKNKSTNNQLVDENNQGLLPVEIPRIRKSFDSIQAYLNIINECKKECSSCNCKENACFCGMLTVSFICLKCLFG